MEIPVGGLVDFLVLGLILIEADSLAPSALALLGLVGGVQAAVQGARGLAEAKQLRQKVEGGGGTGRELDWGLDWEGDLGLVLGLEVVRLKLSYRQRPSPPAAATGLGQA